MPVMMPAARKEFKEQTTHINPPWQPRRHR
jgi:hypothetical protein